MIEKLTPEERRRLTTEIDGDESLVGSKALRIINAQSSKLARVLAEIEGRADSSTVHVYKIRGALVDE